MIKVQKVRKVKKVKKDRGTDGTGLTLKDFVLGQTYNHGDYVFSKPVKIIMTLCISQSEHLMLQKNLVLIWTLKLGGVPSNTWCRWYER